MSRFRPVDAKGIEPLPTPGLAVWGVSRQESNLLLVGLQPTAWPSSPGVIKDQEPAVGLEPTRAPLQEGCSACRAALASEGGRRESNPHTLGSQPGPATALGSATVPQP